MLESVSKNIRNNIYFINPILWAIATPYFTREGY